MDDIRHTNFINFHFTSIDILGFRQLWYLSRPQPEQVQDSEPGAAVSYFMALL
jgi:hypothetical protein